MKVPEKRNRIVGACILLLTVVLALSTAVLAADGQARSGSYSLTIEKKFAEGTPAEAAGQEFIFRVEAQVKKSGSDEYDPVEKIVTITGTGSETIDMGGPFKISVIEQTNGDGFQVAGDSREWNVIKNECVSSMHVGASQATVNISKDGGSIEVTRPADVPDVTFRLTGKPLHGSQEEFDAELAKLNIQDVTVKAGQTVTLGANLPQGEYTITKLRSADGFSVLVGSREFDVPAGEEGKVHINGNDSKITIIAPSADANGPARTHYYTISGGTPYVTREIEVKSGENGVVEHLTEGTYTIKVAETYDGIQGYKLTLPQITTETKTIKWYNAISTTASVKKSYTVVGGDYIGNLTYGPLYDKNGNVLSTATYKFYYGAINPDDPSKINGWSMKKAVKGSTSGNKVDLTGKDVVQRPYQSRLYVGTKEVSDSKAYSLGVSWTEYTKIKMDSNCPKTNTWYRFEIDERGWFTISKPKDTSERGEEVIYYYEITDSNKKPITDFTVTDSEGNAIAKPTDKDGTTVMLKAGQSVTISGLPGNGTYRIKETADSADPMAFRVKLEDTKVSATTPGSTINIETLDERTVEISRPGKPADDGDREYTYKIYKDGEAEPIREIKLHSGQTTTVAEETGSKLPAGKYRIVAADDQIIGFDVRYTDSSSLTSDYIGSAAVTFTNTFNPVEASYHVIHEYYLKKSDGSYSFEGASPVFTKNCDGKSHDDDGGHTSKDVHLLDVYKGNTYTHFSDAYGKVVSWPKGGEEKEVQLGEADSVTTEFINPWRGSNGSGTAEDPGTRDYAYKPLDNLTHAIATKHGEDGSHEGGAQIIILRYFREETVEEQGKYNVIHVYYQRTSSGDKWEGNSELETINIGHLTNENRYTTYDASTVEQILRFTPKKTDTEYSYTYDGAAYGRLVKVDNDGEEYEGDGTAGEGWEYRKDDTMTSVKATAEGDQIIILRYYRSGGYNVVHEYYYREKANDAEDSGDVEEGPDEDTGGEGTSEGQGISLQARDGESSFNGTLSDSDGYTYTFEGSSAIVPYSDKLEAWHDASEVDRVPQFRPNGDRQHTYTSKDAVYGYMEGKDAYHLAPYKTGVTATAQGDEIIILRYYREDEPDTPPHVPDDPDDPDPTYAYRVVHEYYLEDENGNRTLEGKTSVSRVSSDKAQDYDEGDVTKKPDYNNKTYTYTEAAYGPWSSGQNYTANDGWTHVTADERGSEIIILRYVRKLHKGAYKVVHEYYLRDGERGDILEGVTEIETVDGRPLDKTQYTADGVTKRPVYDQRTYTYTEAAYGAWSSGQSYGAKDGQTYVTATEDGSEIIILRYVRERKGAYQVVHEYYHRTAEGDILEGVTEVETIGGLPLDQTQYTANGVTKRPAYEGREYTYTEAAYGKSGAEGYQADPAMAYVSATEDGQEIIILRYIRQDTPQKPELPDPSDPDSPDEITIDEDGVPKTYRKVWDPETEEWVYIEDEDVPLTGDTSRTALWAVLALASLAGVVLLVRTPRKRKDR